MKIVTFRKPLPITDPESFVDLNIDAPSPGPRDLLVEVKAISVNPVDTKIRRGGGPGKADGDLLILGWDAAGVVKEVGGQVTGFKPGDEVFYAGALNRPGSYREFQCVDERLVGLKPKRIGFAEAAALPLTSITAWEMLFDRFQADESTGGSILILGAAGGVGSIAIQLARHLTKMTVIASASRKQTVDWCVRMGADHVVDHSKPLAAQVREIVPAGVNYVMGLTKVEDHYDELIQAMAPQSAIGLIENPASVIDVVKLKPKSISLHWEFMFTRSQLQTPDMHLQGQLLGRISELVDGGTIITTPVADVLADQCRKSEERACSG